MTTLKPPRPRLVLGLILVVAATMAGPGTVVAQAAPDGATGMPMDLQALARALAEGTTGNSAPAAIPSEADALPVDGAAQGSGGSDSGDLPSSVPADAPPVAPPAAVLPDSRWPSSAAALAEIARNEQEALGLDPAADLARRRAELCAFLRQMMTSDEVTSTPTAGCDTPAGS